VLFYNTICIVYYDTFPEKAGKKAGQEKKQQKNFAAELLKQWLKIPCALWLYTEFQL